MFRVATDFLVFRIFHKLVQVMLWILEKFKGEKLSGVITDDKTILSYGKPLKVFSLALLVLGLLFSYLAYDSLRQIEAQASPNDWLAFSVMALFLIIPGLIGYWLSFAEYSFDKSAIVKKAPWQGVSTMKWTKIAIIEHNPALNYYLVSAKDGTSFKISAAYPGIGDFLQEIKKRRIPLREL